MFAVSQNNQLKKKYKRKKNAEYGLLGRSANHTDVTDTGNDQSG
jgi:hypothetical protein